MLRPRPVNLYSHPLNLTEGSLKPQEGEELLNPTSTVLEFCCFLQGLRLTTNVVVSSAATKLIASS